jgi:hypothetical protein
MMVEDDQTQLILQGTPSFSVLVAGSFPCRGLMTGLFRDEQP